MVITADGSVRFPELGLDIEHLTTGIELFGLHISFYGILIACAMLFGLLLTKYLAKKSGQSMELYLDFAIFAIIAGIAGARAVYVLQRWSYFKEAPKEILSLSNGGLSFLGALLAAFLVAWLFCKRKKYELKKLCDTAIVGVLLGQIIGRWRDFFNRDMLGTYSEGLFAMQVEARDVNAETLLLSRQAFVGSDFLQVHPVFLYEIIGNIVLFALLIILYQHKKFSGQVFYTYLLGYGLIRFVTEFFKADKVRLQVASFEINGGQLAAAVMMLVGAGFLIRGFIKYRNKEKGKPRSAVAGSKRQQ